MLTTDDVRRKVEEIRELAPDWEAAHAAEDELYRDVLKAIVIYGGYPASDLARVALQTQEIEFARMMS